MSERIVRTQGELDQAITDKIDRISIRSERGVWIEVTASDESEVRAYDSATVRATGSATVRAYDSATVTASGSATVRASGSATVRASGSATVRASGSATVRASGSATVRAYDSATVRATSHVAVHLHSGRVNLNGGVVIDHTAVNESDAATWCEYHGVGVEDGVATVYKAVDDRWTTSRGTDYSPGSLPSCEDFEDTDGCGGGLHFGPTPAHALRYHDEATKFIAVGVALNELRPITGLTAKCKAPRVVRACVEVDIDGQLVASPR